MFHPRPYRRRQIRRITFPVRLFGGLLLIAAAFGIGLLARAAPPRIVSTDPLHPVPVTSPRLQPQLAPAQPSPLATLDDAASAPIPTAIPHSVPSTVANRNANLRAGPGTNYALAGSVASGQKLTLAGRDVEGDWVRLVDGRWIAAFLVDNAPAGLAVVGAPVAVQAQATATLAIIPTPVRRAQAPVVTSSNCDPAYLGVCIPPPPPDLDCGDISYRRFVVVGSDPHRFDEDYDGIACEQ